MITEAFFCRRMEQIQIPTMKNMQREFFEHPVINEMFPSNPSPQDSGNPMEVEAGKL